MKTKNFFSFIFLCSIIILFSNCGRGSGCDGVTKEPSIVLETITKAGQDVYPLVNRIRVSNSNKAVGKNETGLFLMPLDLNNDQTQYIIQFNNGDEYILTLTYTRKPMYESTKECGFSMLIDNIKQSIPQSTIGVEYRGLGVEVMLIRIN